MADINQTTWHEVDSANTDAPPDGWPEGMPANAVNNCARSDRSAVKRFYDRINSTATSGGSANAHTLTYTVAPTALVKGDRYAFVAGFTNTAATTLNVGVGGALAVKVGSADLGAGTITAGDVVEVAYDGTLFQFLGWDPARIIPQNVTVNSLTTSATLTVGTNETIVGNYLYLANSTGTVNSTGGSFLYGDGSYVVAHTGGVGQFYVENATGSPVFSVSQAGNTVVSGTLAVGGLLTAPDAHLAVATVGGVGFGGGGNVFSATLNVTGASSVNSLVATSASSSAISASAGGIASAGPLNVSGTATIGGAASLSSTLTVASGILINGTFAGLSITTGQISTGAGGTAITAPNGSLTIGADGGFGGSVTANFVASVTDVNAGANVNAGVAAFKPGGGPWSASSDSRVKKNVAPYTVSAAVFQLNPVTYQYNGLGGTSDSGKTYVGLIADDVQAIMPEMVSSSKAKLNPGDAEETDILNINSGPLIYALLNAVKELSVSNKALSDRIAALEVK